MGLVPCSEGVAAGDGGRRWVRVRDVDEDNLGVGACWGFSCCPWRALHARAASKHIKTDDETTFHGSDWWQQVLHAGPCYGRKQHQCFYRLPSSCCWWFFCFDLFVRSYIFTFTCFPTDYTSIFYSKNTFLRWNWLSNLKLSTSPGNDI